MSVCFKLNDEKLIKRSQSSRLNVKTTLFFHESIKIQWPSKLQSPEIKPAGSPGPLPTFLYKTKK